MLKPVSVSIAVILMASSTLAFSEDLTYAQKAQRMLDQSTAQAKKQFDKNYPKPTAPAIPIPNAATGSEAYKPPVPPKNVTPPVKDNFASSSSTPAVVNPPPDININSGRNVQKQEQQNIFMPSGSGTPDNTTTPNPYR